MRAASSSTRPRSGFYANDERLYELYEVIAAAKLPALFHTGQTAVGQGAGAGGGVRLKYGNPIYLDDVAVDFPDMPIIMAHPSFPWQDEALAIALHKAQVYIDLSGWSPKYFPPLLVQYANTLLKNKVLFGSDHPMITVDRWMADFEAAGFRDEVRPLILKENAAQPVRPHVGVGAPMAIRQLLGARGRDIPTKSPSSTHDEQPPLERATSWQPSTS